VPISITTITLPCGSPCVRLECLGVVSKEDADQMMAVVGEGGTMFGVPMLIQSERQKSLSPEARSLFNKGFDSRNEQAWCGVVVLNPLLRVTVNFMTRVTGNRKVKMFASEAEATRWLDDRAREDRAKPGAT
jgi:hypothetical protein